MDNFGLWLLLGLAIALIGAWATLRRVRSNNAKLFQAELTPERSAAAAAKLDAEQHRAVYRYLAMDNLLGAAQTIRNATRQSPRDCLLDAQALARFPQVPGASSAQGQGGHPRAANDVVEGSFADESAPSAASPAQTASAADADTEDAPDLPDLPAQAPDDGAREPGGDDNVSADEARLVGGNGFDADAAGDAEFLGSLDDADWVIPEEWEEAYGGELGSSERHMEFTHHDGDQLRRFSTQDLPDAERDQLMSQLRDGDMRQAAELISEKVGLDADEVEMALRANHESGQDKVDGIAVRFNREDGEPVEFSTQDLPVDERDEFITALRAGDLATASQVVSRHTGLSQEQALGMLKAFRPPQ